MAREDELTTLGATLGRLRPGQPPLAMPGNVRVQRDGAIEPGSDGVSARGSLGIEAGGNVRAGPGSANFRAGASGRVEGEVSRAEGMLRYSLSGEVEGFLSAGASARGFGASFRASERGTARFEVAVPETAPPGTDLRSINPFDPTTMPVGTRVTLDAARHGSREFDANLRGLATSDRVSDERGVSVAIEATAPGRVRVTAGPREAVEAYHGVGVQAGGVRAMVGRNDRLAGGTLRTAEFDLTSDPGREAYGRFIASGSLPQRDGPGVSEVSATSRLDYRSNAQLDLGLGQRNQRFATDPNVGSTVRTEDGQGGATLRTTLRYGGRDQQLEIERSFQGQTPTGRTYAFRFTPNAREADELNAAYGREGAPAPFRAGQEALLRFDDAQMQRLQALTERAGRAGGGSDSLRALTASPEDGARPTGPADLAVNLLRGHPGLVHALSQTDQITRATHPGRGDEAYAGLPGTVESPPRSMPAPGRREPPSAPTAPDPAEPRVSALPPNNPSHPDHALFAAIRSRAPRDLDDARIAQATLQAREAGIAPDRVANVAVANGRLWIDGGMPGVRTDVDLSRAAPTLEDTSARLQLAAADQVQQQARERQAETERQPPVLARG